MKKQLLILIFVLTSVMSLGENKAVKTLKFDVKETVYVNNRKSTSEYRIEYVYPDKIRKEIVTPKLNEGEVYLYNKNRKKVYLPLFEEEIVSDIEQQENEIIDILNYLLDKIDNDEVFRKEYYAGNIKEIEFDRETKIKFDKYIRNGEFFLPEKLEIFDGNIKVAELEIINYKVNGIIPKEEFEF